MCSLSDLFLQTPSPPLEVLKSLYESGVALGAADAFDRIPDCALIVSENGTAPVEDFPSKPMARFDTVYCMNIWILLGRYL